MALNYITVLIFILKQIYSQVTTSSGLFFSSQMWNANKLQNKVFLVPAWAKSIGNVKYIWNFPNTKVKYPTLNLARQNNMIIS